jgi:uroporphyrinogen decarboxylase
LEILNPVQTSAAEMQPERLKREFGDALTFWGALDTQHIVPFGTTKEVADEVKHLMEVLGQDGGYIFAPGHNIQPLVPPENIKAMLDAAYEYRSL